MTDTTRNCERCDKPQSWGHRRYRCSQCRRLVCYRCQTACGNTSRCHSCQEAIDRGQRKRISEINIASASSSGVTHWWRVVNGQERTACGRRIAPHDSSWVSRDEARQQIDCNKCRDAIPR